MDVATGAAKWSQWHMSLKPIFFLMASRSWLLWVQKHIQSYKSLRKHFPGDAVGSFQVQLNKKSWSSRIISRWAYSASKCTNQIQPLGKKRKKRKEKCSTWALQSQRWRHLLYTGYGYKPSCLQTPFQKTSTIIWLSCIAEYRIQFPTPAMMFEPSLYQFFFSLLC